MSQNSVLNFTEGDLIPSPTTHYHAQKDLGNGAFGMVIQCRNVTTGETVALKIIKSKEYIDCAQEEEVILQIMKKLHSDRFNIVRFKESFFYKEHYCLVFELLDMDLQKFQQISPGQHLQLKQIRPILHQLATALVFMSSAGIIHADLKPNNIMLVDHVRQPLKVKVIDFGLALDDPEEMIGEVLQSLCYRSPEILYEDPFSGAIDVWSLGCIAAELSMGTPLFPACDENDLMNQIAFATRDPQQEGNLLPHAFWPRYWMEGRFMGNHPLWEEDVQVEYCDLQCFMDLMTQMLMESPFERITPGRILQHPFITMSHLQGSCKNTLYVKSCKDLMDTCQDQSSEDGGHGDQVILQMSLKEESSISTASPAKEGSKVNAKSGNRPEDTQAKVRRSDRLTATRKGTSGKTGQIKCQRMISTASPAKEGSPAGMRDEKHSKMNAKRGNSPEDSQAKVRRSERLAATRKGTSGQTGPIKCQRMISTASPAKEGSPAGMRDEKHSKMNAKRGNSPEDSQAKVRRSERLAATRKGTSGQTGPIKCQRMREIGGRVGKTRFMGRRRVELAL